jgi:hypothetical protein
MPSRRRNLGVLILVASGLSLLRLPAFGQGTVTFINDAASLITYREPCGSLVPVPSSFSVGLFYGAAGSSESALALAGLAQVGPVPGRYDGGIISVNGLAGGANATLQVRAWSGAPSYQAYQAAFVTPGALTGRSAPWTQRLGGPAPTPPVPITQPLGGLTGFQVFSYCLSCPPVPCPEPSMGMLVLLAGGIFWLGRWLKRN